MVKRRSLADIPCSIARALDVIGEWWTPLVLRDVAYGLTRFEEIATDLPIGRNILSDRLGTLVSEGLLETREYSRNPPRHSYHLTPKGDATFQVLLTLMRWGDDWANPHARPPVTIVCHGCDKPTIPQVTCSTCGDELTVSSVGVRPNHGQTTPRPQLALHHADPAPPE